MTTSSVKSSTRKIAPPAPSRALLHRLPRPSAMLVVPVALLCTPAHAYLGPGAGLGVIGTLFGIIAAIVLAMVGLLWYPLKRAFGKKAAPEGAPASDTSPAAVADPAPTPLNETGAERMANPAGDVGQHTSSAPKQ